MTLALVVGDHEVTVACEMSLDRLSLGRFPRVSDYHEKEIQNTRLRYRMLERLPQSSHACIP